MARLGLEGAHASRKTVAKQQRQGHVEGQAGERQSPCPAQPGREGQRPSVEQAVPHPCVQPAETAEVAAEHVLDGAMDHGSRVASHTAADDHGIAADVRIRPEVQIAQHRDGVAVDLAVDGGVAENGHGAVAHLTADPGISENRNDIAGVAAAGRRTEHGHDGVGRFTFPQSRIVADVEQIVAVSMVAASGMMRIPILGMIGRFLDGSRRSGRRGIGSRRRFRRLCCRGAERAEQGQRRRRHHRQRYESSQHESIHRIGVTCHCESG